MVITTTKNCKIDVKFRCSVIKLERIIRCEKKMFERNKKSENEIECIRNELLQLYKMASDETLHLPS
jgi:hypothetical protein